MGARWQRDVVEVVENRRNSVSIHKDNIKYWKNSASLSSNRLVPSKPWWHSQCFLCGFWTCKLLNAWSYDNYPIVFNFIVIGFILLYSEYCVNKISHPTCHLRRACRRYFKELVLKWTSTLRATLGSLNSAIAAQDITTQISLAYKLRLALASSLGWSRSAAKFSYPSISSPTFDKHHTPISPR